MLIMHYLAFISASLEGINVMSNFNYIPMFFTVLTRFLFYFLFSLSSKEYDHTLDKYKSFLLNVINNLISYCFELFLNVLLRLLKVYDIIINK